METSDNHVPTHRMVNHLRAESRYVRADGKDKVADRFLAAADRLEKQAAFIDSLGNPNIVHALMMYPNSSVARLRESHVRHLWPDLFDKPVDLNRSTADSKILDAMFKEGVYTCLSHEARYADSVRKLAIMYKNALELDEFTSEEAPGSTVLTLRRVYSPDKEME